jgi:hypothetical protein
MASASASTSFQYFSSNFRRQQGSDGKYVYWFDSVYLNTNGRPIETPFDLISGDYAIAKPPSKEDVLQDIPEDLNNPLIWKAVYTQWLKDCSGAFVKSPTLESCISKTQSLVLPTFQLPPLPSNEISEDFQYVWLPMQIKFTTHQIQIYWQPQGVVLKSRIDLEDDEDSSTESATGAAVDIQNPEKTYTFVPQQSRTEAGNQWLQELADLHIPYTDGAPLRLQSSADQDAQKEKFRKRVREARLRAKLARYRAERMALRFEERYGYYPEEDVEEAQTEAESESDE